MATIAAEYDLAACPTCLVAAGYGVDSPEVRDYLRPDDPEPLALLAFYVDHPHWVITRRDEYPWALTEHDEYPGPTFSTSPCGLCGSTISGDRYDVTLTEFDPPATLSKFAVKG